MLYFELLEGSRATYRQKALEPGYYCAGDDVPISAISYFSSRVWDEYDGVVTYHKNNLEDTSKVDLQEFMFIKLKAKELK